MFIILEGCDGTGKSTVAEKLKHQLEQQDAAVDLLHRGVPERDVLDEYQYDVEYFRPGLGHAIIADRWHWGDIVYGELYRGSSYLGGTHGAGFRFVELFLRSRGAVTVLLTNTEDEIRRRLSERGEDYLQMEHVRRVLDRYDEVYEASVTGVLTTVEPDPAEILKHAAFWAGQAEDLAPFPTYIGARTPRVLLVGDRRGNASTASLAAFRPTTKGNSAQFLLEALPEKLWRDVGLCNANEEADLPALIDVLATPPIVALGHEASKALRLQGIEHSAVPHPQKIRRFHHKEQLRYGQLVQDVIGKNTKEFAWQR